MVCCSNNRSLGDAAGAAAPAPAEGDIQALIRTHGILIAALRKLVVNEPLYSAREHDDLSLLRFLLSHSLSVERAARAFRTALEWRAAHGVDAIAAELRAGLRQPDFPHYARVQQGMPFHLLGFETGVEQPVMYISVPELKIPQMMRDGLTADQYVLYNRYLTEHIWQTVDAAQRRTGRLVKLVRVIDARDMSLRHVSMKFFNAVAAAARGAEDVYPQMIGGFFLCNTGSAMKFFFEHTIRPLLPSRVVGKTAFYEPLLQPADLEALLGWLPRERLPIAVGGLNELRARPHPNGRA
jgi:hypothetical protein